MKALRLITIGLLFLGGVASPITQAQENVSRYSTSDGLVMAGYQGWFTAEGDGAGRGWHHYEKRGRFEPGSSTIDLWPDVSEYPITYPTAFKYADGTPAHVYSPYDESSVDLHFKWMKEYGIDGVYMQRFVVEVKNPQGKRHFNQVLTHALKAAKKYGRAISVMYDLSGSRSGDTDFILEDWKELQKEFDLFDESRNPGYLRHKEKPLLAIWGVGFNDGRRYPLDDVQRLIRKVKGENNDVSVMLGVPYFWRALSRDTVNDPLLHEIIRSVDVIMPWAVGRYHHENYQRVSEDVLKGDIAWCQENKIHYIPLVFPGFSWGNLRGDPSLYRQIPRQKGEFFWRQVAGAKQAGAESLYVAMFDEVDEGTAIFKCLKEGETPLNGDGSFVGIEADLEEDHYLWLTGQAARWIRGEQGFGAETPVRTPK